MKRELADFLLCQPAMSLQNITGFSVKIEQFDPAKK